MPTGSYCGDKVRDLESELCRSSRIELKSKVTPANLTVDMIMGAPSEDDVYRKIFQTVCGDKLAYKRYLLDVIIQRNTDLMAKHATQAEKMQNRFNTDSGLRDILLKELHSRSKRTESSEVQTQILGTNEWHLCVLLKSLAELELDCQLTVQKITLLI